VLDLHIQRLFCGIGEDGVEIGRSVASELSALGIESTTETQISLGLGLVTELLVDGQHAEQAVAIIERLQPFETPEDIFEPVEETLSSPTTVSSPPSRSERWATRAVASMLALTATGLVYQGRQAHIMRHDWGDIAGFLLVVGLLGYGAKVLIGRHERLEQQSRDVKAISMNEAIAMGVPLDPFALYLRPFFVTNRLTAANPSYHSSPLTTASYLHRRVIDLEERLLVALAPMPLYALGRRGEAVGAGRLQTSNDVWQQQFIAWAQNATLIIVIPSDRPGTRWELEWLKSQGELSRCVFIVPPSDSFAELNVAAVWESIRTGLADAFEIPEYASEGRFFTLTETGRLDHVHPLTLARTAIDEIIHSRE
jgi:hypothetical protein